MFCARAEKVAPPGFRRRSSAVSVIATCLLCREEVLEADLIGDEEAIRGQCNPRPSACCFQSIGGEGYVPSS